MKGDGATQDLFNSIIMLGALQGQQIPHYLKRLKKFTGHNYLADYIIAISILLVKMRIGI